MKKFVISALVAASAASPAWAWGDREQGIVTGIAAVLALQHISKQNQAYPSGQPPVVVGQQPVIVGQAPVIIYPGQPVYRQHCWPQEIGRDPYTGVPFYQTRCRLQQY